MTIDIHLLKSNPILAGIDDDTLHRFVEKAEVLRVGSYHSLLPETQNNDDPATGYKVALALGKQVIQRTKQVSTS